MPNQLTWNIRRFLSVMACAFMMLIAVTTSAQNTGTISGTVRDSAGKVIVGAKVSVFDLQHNSMARVLTTTSSGTYSALDLITSDYQISAEITGFSKATVDHIALHIHDQLSINLTLTVGNVQETITVEAPTVEIETTSSSGSTLINATQIIDLPLSTREFTGLTGIQPGVSSAAGSAGGISISINGQRSTANNWTADGADNVSRGANTNVAVKPSIDAIAEFKTQRNTYSAEYGRSASGQIDVVTKSGTSQFHGSAYEFFRNDVLDGNNYFNNLVGAARPPLRYNDFGYTLGGPIMIPHKYNQKKDKSFFFFSQEIHRIVDFSTLSLTGDPTEAELIGVFPSLTLSSINSTAQAYVKDIYSKIPRPNNPSVTNGLITTQRTYETPHQEIVRIDHTFTPSLSTFFKFENDSSPSDSPGGGFPGVNDARDDDENKQIVVRATWIKSPTLLFDIGYAYTKLGRHDYPVGYMSTSISTDITPTLTLPYISTLGRVPELSFDGGTSLDTTGPWNDYDYTHNAVINMSKLLGRHSLRTGITYYSYEKTENVASYNEGEYEFTNDNTTKCPTTLTTSFQISFCNFLTGYATQFIQLSQDTVADVITNQMEGYIQDTWTVNPRLTINAGIRYSWVQQPYAGNHKLTNFYPKSYNSNYAPTMNTYDGYAGTLCITGGIYCDSGKSPNSSYSSTNGIIIADNNSPWNSRVAPQSWLNFAPRLGFSFDVFGNGKTAFRGGYGLAYDTTLYGIYEESIMADPPYAKLVVMRNASFSNPSSGTNYGIVPRPLYATSTQSSTPYSQQFSAGIEQQILRNLIAKISYVGSTGTHLIGGVDLNQPKPGAYITAGIAKADGITSSNTMALNLIRPYVGYTAIDAVVPWFTSNYHSLQSQLQKRFADGSLIDLNYTWSRNMTTNQADRDKGSQNLYDLHADYGRAAFDRRHIFSADFVYALPIFRAANGWKAITVKNWKVGGMAFVNSGLPATPKYYFKNSTLSSADPAGLGLLDSDSYAHAMMRPDQISDPNVSAPHTRTEWFNTSAYENIPAGEIRPGNATVGGINSPGYFRVDLAVYKTFELLKMFKLELRVEAVNAFNHTSFDAIDTSGLSSSFGQVTGAADPRIMQLAGRIYF